MSSEVVFPRVAFACVFYVKTTTVEEVCVAAVPVLSYLISCCRPHDICQSFYSPCANANTGPKTTESSKTVVTTTTTDLFREPEEGAVGRFPKRKLFVFAFSEPETGVKIKNKKFDTKHMGFGGQETRSSFF